MQLPKLHGSSARDGQQGLPIRQGDGVSGVVSQPRRTSFLLKRRQHDNIPCIGAHSAVPMTSLSPLIKTPSSPVYPICLSLAGLPLCTIPFCSSIHLPAFPAACSPTCKIAIAVGWTRHTAAGASLARPLRLQTLFCSPPFRGACPAFHLLHTLFHPDRHVFTLLPLKRFRLRLRALHILQARRRIPHGPECPSLLSTTDQSR